MATCFLVSAICDSAADAGQVTLEWDPGLASDLAGDKVYRGTSSEMYDFTIDIGNWTSCTICSLEDDETCYFAVTPYTIYGEESEVLGKVDSNSANASGDGGGGGDVCFIDTAAYELRVAK